MKKNVLYVLMMVLAFGFTACSDDDDDKTASEKAAGTYNGTLTFMTEGGPQQTNNDVVLAVASDTTVDVTLKNFNFPPITGDLQINRVKVSSYAIGYTLAGSGTVMVDLLGTGTPNVPATVSIVTGSTVIGKALTLAISVNIPTEGDPLIISGITFAGTRK